MSKCEYHHRKYLIYLKRNVKYTFSCFSYIILLHLIKVLIKNVDLIKMWLTLNVKWIFRVYDTFAYLSGFILLCIGIKFNIQLRKNYGVKNFRENLIEYVDKLFLREIPYKKKFCLECKKEIDKVKYYINKNILATRWLEVNIIFLCDECYEKNKYHLYDYIIARNDDKLIVEALYKLSNENIYFSTKDLFEIVDFYITPVYYRHRIRGGKYQKVTKRLIEIMNELKEKYNS